MALLTSLAPLAAGAAERWEAAATGAAQMVRPDAAGTSTLVCARCGDARHTMLDPECPAVTAHPGGIQSAARHGAKPAGTQTS